MVVVHLKKNQCANKKNNFFSNLKFSFRINRELFIFSLFSFIFVPNECESLLLLNNFFTLQKISCEETSQQSISTKNIVEFITKSAPQNSRNFSF